MKLVYITSRFPYPIEKGDKLRAFYQIRSLAAHHDVHLLALTDTAVTKEQEDALSEYCASIRTYVIPKWKTPVNIFHGWLNGLPFQVGFFLDSVAKKRLQSDIVELEPDRIVSQLIRTSEYVRNLPYRKTLDYMDAFSFGASQRGATGPFWLRPLYRLESKLVTRYEQRIYAAFDNHMIISVQDRDRLPLPYPRSVHVVPNGVDTQFYTPHSRNSRWQILFVGNMGYEPNIEAAEFLVNRVMPIIWRELPQATVCLAGARPGTRVRRLESEKVTVTGWVEDIRDNYEQAEVFVAPMFSGMGLQNKMLEAMSMALPCITTTIVNNAIGAEPGEEIAVGNSAQEIAHQALDLLRDRKRAQSIASHARTFVTRHFDWHAQNEQLEAMMAESKFAREVTTI